jgi:hypothetical protein
VLKEKIKKFVYIGVEENFLKFCSIKDCYLRWKINKNKIKTKYLKEKIRGFKGNFNDK